MDMFSLRTIIDDILLIVRNNNISESEDLSRDQIAAWVLAYKAFLAKKQQDKDKETGGDVENDDSMQKTIGPIKLKEVPVEGNPCAQRKRTVEKLPDISGESSNDIVSVTDKYGCVIQFMNDKRRHFHYFRRYTYGEPVCWYEDGYLYVEGVNIDDIDSITVDGNFVTGGDDAGEDDVKIPGWMIPDIKTLIMKNELSFMLNRPSDDSNNSTLASVKPHGPQDQEE